MQCVEDPIRVLILEAKPHWFTRNIQRALMLDSNLHLTSRHALGEHREIELSDSMQHVVSDELQLKNHDVIILGQQVHTMLTDSQQIELEKWVSQGGGLLWLRGSKIDSDLWPQSLIPQADDQINSLLRQRLNHDGVFPEGLLQHRQLGQGNAIRLNNDLLDGSANGDKQLNLLVTRVAHHLAKPLSPSSNLYANMQLDRHATTAGESIQIKITVRNNSVPKLTVIQPDNESVELKLQQDSLNLLVWKTEFSPKLPGVYSLNLSSHEIKQAFTVRPIDDESMYLGTNHHLLKQIASQTGGAFWTAPQQMLDTLVNEQQLKLGKEKRAITKTYFNHPLLVIVIVGLWLLSWYFSQRRGRA